MGEGGLMLDTRRLGRVRTRRSGEIVLAADGLSARINGEWAEAKLSFLDYYAPVAIDATEQKHRRVYIDLFAGPGGPEIAGQPTGEVEG